MVATGFLNPLVQIGREIRVEIAMVIAASPLGDWQRRASEPPALPEQRVDDVAAIEQRKARALLQSMRLGAVRR